MYGLAGCFLLRFISCNATQQEKRLCKKRNAKRTKRDRSNKYKKRNAKPNAKRLGITRDQTKEYKKRKKD